MWLATLSLLPFPTPMPLPQGTAGAAAPQVLELQKVQDPAGDALDLFGRSVALSEGLLAVGAPRDEESGLVPGSVTVFQRDDAGTPGAPADDAWVPLGRLVAPGATDGALFGWSLALDGDTLHVGAPDESTAAERSGAVYVYQRSDAGTPGDLFDDDFLLLDELRPTAPRPIDRFGWSLDAEGGTLLVGAPRELHEWDFPTRAVVFERDSQGTPDALDDRWLETGQFDHPVGDGSDEFGMGVALLADTAFVGATRDDTSAGDGGRVFAFARDDKGTPGDRLDDTWSATSAFGGLDIGQNDRFGFALDTDEPHLVVGAYIHDGHAPDYGFGKGSAYVFVRDDPGTPGVPADDTWTQTAELHKSDLNSFALLGSSVTLCGERIAVGAPESDTLGDGAGEVFLWRRSPLGGWLFEGAVPATGLDAEDQFGIAVDLSAEDLAVGVWRDDDLGTGAGAVRLYGAPVQPDVPLWGSPSVISSIAGGQQQLELDAGPERALWLYLLAGSASGAAPGFDLGGASVPLNWDAYTGATVTVPNSPPLVSSLGFLDAEGEALATFQLPPAAVPGLAGLTLHHAFVALDLLGGSGGLFVSNAFPLALEP